MEKRLKRVLLMWCLFVISVFGVTVSAKAASPTVSYSSHIQNIGWQGYKSNGNVSGTTGKALRMEALKVKISGISGGVSYKVHVQGKGWMKWVSDDAVAGTTGQGLRIEAVQIKLTGTAANQYDIYYRVHVANLDWLDWAKNGDIAGSTGCGLQAEAIQIQLIKKNENAPGNINRASVSKPSVKYKAHVAMNGWQSYVSDGATAGTTGQSKRIEALCISLTDLLGGSGIKYRSHLQEAGWTEWTTSNKMTGTTGQSRRMEAIQIELTGKSSLVFDVYYRTHVENMGWLGWAKNGEQAGTQGGSLAMEAIQIKLVLKGENINRNGTAFYDLTPVNVNNGIRLQHFMTQSLHQPYSGPCCAYAYGIGLSIIYKHNFDPMEFYWDKQCHYTKGHVRSMQRYNHSDILSNLERGYPVMVDYYYGVRGEHWVLIIGIRNNYDPNNIEDSDFIAIDSAYGDERMLTDCWYFNRDRVDGIKLMT